MGAWGTGSFENDDACDWVDELVETSDVALVGEGLALAVGRADLESPEGCIVLAAAEVVACLLGKPPGGELPEGLEAFVAGCPAPTPALVAAARDGVERVASEESELRVLWDESPSAGEWHAYIADLKRRLA